MHLAPCHAGLDPAFAPSHSAPRILKRDAIRIEAQISSALEALKAKIHYSPRYAADGAALLLSRRRELIDRARSITSGDGGGKRIRIHGDYHLGQTLRTTGEKTRRAILSCSTSKASPPGPLKSAAANSRP